MKLVTTTEPQAVENLKACSEVFVQIAGKEKLFVKINKSVAKDIFSKGLAELGLVAVSDCEVMSIEIQER